MNTLTDMFAGPQKQTRSLPPDGADSGQGLAGSWRPGLQGCAGDDLNVKWGVRFPKVVKVKPGETVVFSYVVFKSRADRDRVNAKVMKDPRLAKMMDPKAIRSTISAWSMADSRFWLRHSEHWMSSQQRMCCKSLGGCCVGK